MIQKWIWFWSSECSKSEMTRWERTILHHVYIRVYLTVYKQTVNNSEFWKISHDNLNVGLRWSNLIIQYWPVLMECGYYGPNRLFSTDFFLTMVIFEILLETYRCRILKRFVLLLLQNPSSFWLVFSEYLPSKRIWYDWSGHSILSLYMAGTC